jgi:hypothetical protein
MTTKANKPEAYLCAVPGPGHEAAEDGLPGLRGRDGAGARAGITEPNRPRHGDQR